MNSRMKRLFLNLDETFLEKFIMIKLHVFHVFFMFKLFFFLFVLVFGMLLGETIILDDLDAANNYRKKVIDQFYAMLSVGLKIATGYFIAVKFYSKALRCVR